MRANAGELAQCTAHRETWEESGLDVEVGGLLHVFDSGFRLYQCRMTGEFPYGSAGAEPPAWIYREVSAVQLTDPRLTEPSDWRFASNQAVLSTYMRDLISR